MDKRKLNKVVRDVKKILVLAKSAHDHLESNQIRKAQRELKRVMSYDADEITRLQNEDEGMAHQLLHECGVTLKDVKKALRDLNFSELFDEAKQLINEIVALEGHELIELEEKEKLENNLYEFWYNEIRTREIYHGSSTFYLEHIRKHGLGLPKPFTEEIERMIAFCQKFKHYVGPYFDDFLRRFRAEDTVLHFSFDLFVAEREFARGSRKGGEYMRALRGLILNLNQAISGKESELDKKDKFEKAFIEKFLNDEKEHKGMLISIKCGHPALDSGLNFTGKCRIGSYNAFSQWLLRVRGLSVDMLENQIYPITRRQWNDPDYEIVIRIKEPIPVKDITITLFD